MDVGAVLDRLRRLCGSRLLDDRQNIAFGVLEPGGFGAAAAMAPLGLLSLGMS